MKRFILAAKADYPTTVSAMTAGQVGLVYLKDGVETMVTEDNVATEVFKRANFVVKRGDNKVGTVYVPVFKNNISFVKSEYRAGAEFTAKVHIAAPVAKSDYTIIIAKKGVKFNERNKWTTTIHTGAVPGSAQDLSKALAKHINSNTVGHGVTAVGNATDVTITAVDSGVDYEIIVADALMGATIDSVTHGLPAINDAAAMRKLAKECAANDGFEYTYDEFEGFYPGYNKDPLAAAPAADAGFTVFTIRFAEPREMKTRDEVVHQLIHIAYPTSSEAIAKMEKVLAGIVK